MFQQILLRPVFGTGVNIQGVGGGSFIIIALLAVVDQVGIGIDQPGADLPGKVRELNRRRRIDLLCQLRLLFAGENAGHGGGVDDHIRAQLPDQPPIRLLKIELKNLPRRQVSQRLMMTALGI